MKHEVHFQYEEFASLEALNAEQIELVLAARHATKRSYAPYSKFHVGAAARLSNGIIVQGSNKENASFPAGTCAERNVLHSVSDQFPRERVMALAISAEAERFDVDMPLAPCGVCRQVICEVEKVQGQPIQLLLDSNGGNIFVINASHFLLPFHFYLPELKK
jgi:cytidine deaminase